MLQRFLTMPRSSTVSQLLAASQNALCTANTKASAKPGQFVITAIHDLWCIVFSNELLPPDVRASVYLSCLNCLKMELFSRTYWTISLYLLLLLCICISLD